MATSTGGEATEVLSPAEPGALTLIRARGRWRGLIGLFGPAFMAAVVGIDPVTSRGS